MAFFSTFVLSSETIGIVIMAIESTISALKKLPDWEIGRNQETSLIDAGELREHLVGLREVAFEMEDMVMDIDHEDSVASLRVLALRNLARAGMREDVEEILDLVYMLEYEDPDFSDAIIADLDWLMVTFGEVAIEPLTGVAANIRLEELTRIYAVNALIHLAVAGHRPDEIWNLFRDLLRRGPLHRSVNGLMLVGLAEHQGSEEADFVLAIYDENLVDVTMCGDREQLEITLGLREKRDTKAPRLGELEEQRRAAYYRKKLGSLSEEASSEVIIDHFLILYHRPTCAKDAAMVHGLLSALIVSPQMPPPSAVMNIIWDTRGADREKMPIWEGMEELQLFSGAVMAFYNEIVTDFDHGGYLPPLLEVEVESEEDDFEEMEGPFFSLESWSDGLADAAEYLKKIQGLNDFTEGLDAVAEELAMETLKYPVMDEAQAEVSCFNAVDFLTAARNEQQGNPPLSEVSPTAGTFSPYDLPPTEQVTRESPKIGRNDPCPCGSGKKFKRCCAN